MVVLCLKINIYLVGTVQTTNHQEHHQSAFSDYVQYQNQLLAKCSEAADTGYSAELVGLPRDTFPSGDDRENAADTSHPAELVGLPRDTIPSGDDEKFAANQIGLLLHLITRSGGRVQALSPNVWIIDIYGQTMIVSCTQSSEYYRTCLRESIEIPKSVAMWRNYLTSWGISSTTAMIEDVPIIVAFGGESVLLPTSSYDSQV